MRGSPSASSSLAVPDDRCDRGSDKNAGNVGNVVGYRHYEMLIQSTSY